MKRIIALVDSSPYALGVCDLAAQLALRTGAEVQLLHCLDARGAPPAAPDLSGSIGLGARSELLGELAQLDQQRAVLAQQHGRALLDDARERVQQQGVQTVSARLVQANVVDAALEAQADADLLVMGKRGEHADVAEEHLGSNLERVLRSSTGPVLVATLTSRPVQRILVAYDGGRSVEKIVDYLASEPGMLGTDLRLLTVGQPRGMDPARLDAAVSKLRAAGYSADPATAPGEPETVIPQQVADEGVDLLVMGAFGHSRIRRLVLGSTTMQMLQRCTIPVLLVR